MVCRDNVRDPYIEKEHRFRKSETGGKVLFLLHYFHFHQCPIDGVLKIQFGGKLCVL